MAGWHKFCQAIDRPDLIEREGATSGPERAKNMSGWLGEIIEEWFAKCSKSEAVTKLLDAGLAIGPVQNAQEVYECPHLEARKTLVDIPDPILGQVKLVGSPVKLSSSPDPVTQAAPLLGENSREILRDTLGYSEENIELLAQQGVF